MARGAGAEGKPRMTISGDLAQFAAQVDAARLPHPARQTIRLLMLDVAGLCTAARGLDYMAAARASAVSPGRATAFGHEGGVRPCDRPLIRGTGAEGGDDEDRFEGGPVNAGAVIGPAVLAAAEHRGLSGAAVVKGIAVGVEIMCRMSLVAPEATHKASFHPTAVFGAPAAAAGVAAPPGPPDDKIAQSIGVAGNASSGLIII